MLSSSYPLQKLKLPAVRDPAHFKTSQVALLVHTSFEEVWYEQFSSIFTTSVPRTALVQQCTKWCNTNAALHSKERHGPGQKPPPWHIQILTDAKASWTKTAASVFIQLPAPRWWVFFKATPTIQELSKAPLPATDSTLRWEHSTWQGQLAVILLKKQMDREE